MVRMSRYASWYAQNAMAQALQVQVQVVKLSKVCALRYRAPALAKVTSETPKKRPATV